MRRNFELRGLSGRFLHAAPVGLPLESASIDVACVAGLLEMAQEPQAVINEIYRVLKPGGKVLAVTPSWFDVDCWRRCVFFWRRWLRRQPSARDEVLRFTGRTLKRLFGRYVEHRLHKRQLRRRAAVEPVIGHLKAEHRMGRNYLWFRHGDAANAVLAAAGYNFRRLIRWLSLLLSRILSALVPTPQPV